MGFSKDVVVVVMGREAQRTADERLVEREAPTFANRAAGDVAARNEADIGGCGREYTARFGHDHGDVAAIRGCTHIGAGQLRHRSRGREKRTRERGDEFYSRHQSLQKIEAGDYFQSTGSSRLNAIRTPA